MKRAVGDRAKIEPTNSPVSSVHYSKAPLGAFFLTFCGSRCEKNHLCEALLTDAIKGIYCN